VLKKKLWVRGIEPPRLREGGPLERPGNPGAKWRGVKKRDHTGVPEKKNPSNVVLGSGAIEKRRDKRGVSGGQSHLTGKKEPPTTKRKVLSRSLINVSKRGVQTGVEFRSGQKPAGLTSTPPIRVKQRENRRYARGGTGDKIGNPEKREKRRDRVGLEGQPKSCADTLILVQGKKQRATRTRDQLGSARTPTDRSTSDQ